jgi:hypothetical protein
LGKPYTIVLDNDITLDQKIRIEHSVILDLNDNVITVKEDKDRFVVGKRTFVRRDKYEKTIPGYWTSAIDTKTTSNDGGYYYDALGHIQQMPKTNEYVHRSVWIPAEKEIQYENIYDYADDVIVTIKNGKIIRAKGEIGLDGLKNTWRDSNGTTGSEPYAPISVISGILKLDRCTVQGGDGGDGGMGSYTPEWHIPFLTGNGQVGGRGSNGGYGVYIERNACTVYLSNDAAILGGKGGKGGKGGSANPRYWIISGFKGNDGQNGIMSKISNMPKRIL